MRASVVALVLCLAVFGCKKKEAKEPPEPDKKHIDFRPTGGSSTVLGKSRDRALDLRLMNEMKQVKLGLDADFDGRSPANKAGWLAFLRDYATLRALVDKGEVVAFNNIDTRRAGADTVLMYETRVETEDDGIVLTADGQPRRMNKAQFAALTKPK